MDNNAFGSICVHDRLERIDKNFVRCLRCGESLVSQAQVLPNKTMNEFLAETKAPLKNFDRNFSNNIEQNLNTNNTPLLEYYMDRMKMNRVVVDRRPKFSYDQPKYVVVVNGNSDYLTDDQIYKMLSTTKCFRVDEATFKS